MSVAAEETRCARCGSAWNISPGQRYCIDCNIDSDNERNGRITVPSEWLPVAADERVVVPGTTKGNGYQHHIENDRYASRRVDVADLLSRPAQPIPWRVHDFVADGTLTIVSGESGSGKSWLAQALCMGVHAGRRPRACFVARARRSTWTAKWRQPCSSTSGSGRPE